MPLFLSIAALLGSCKSGTDPGNFEPSIASITVSIGGLTYHGSKTANGFSGQVANVSGQSVISATFFRSDGSQELNLTPSNFEFRIVRNEVGDPLPAGLTWEQTSAFSGTFAGLSEGQTADVYVGLYHVSQSHWDFGPYRLTLNFPVSGGGGGGGGNPL